MENLKENRGITLVALIITIVVLLILAVVAINVVQDGGILPHAKNAQQEYLNSSEGEKSTLNYYSEYIDSQINPWKQNKTIISRGKIELEVGDYVNYVANVEGYNDNNGWKVLGAENGELLLISSDLIVNEFTLNGKLDYLNNVGITKINNECKKYFNEKYALEARGISIEDVNRITGYDPNMTGNGEIYGKGKLDEYNNLVTYSLANGKIHWESKNGSGTTTDNMKFILLNGSKLGERDNEILKINNNIYTYYTRTLEEDNANEKETKGIADNSKAFNTLFKDRSNTKPLEYWTNSLSAHAEEGYIRYAFRYIRNYNGSGIISAHSVYGTDKEDIERSKGIRAVIRLKPSININTKDENGIWKLEI